MFHLNPAVLFSVLLLVTRQVFAGGVNIPINVRTQLTLSLRDIMFHLNPAVLLSVLLPVTCQVSPGNTVDHRNILVSRGESVTFNCNISDENTALISWRKGNFLFSHFQLKNQTFSNFTSRVKINANLSLKLNLLKAQCDDAGLYTCSVTEISGLSIIHWNLTVIEGTDEVPDVRSWRNFPYVLSCLSVIGILLCGIPPTVWLCCRQMRNKNKNFVQLCVELREEIVVPQPHTVVEYRLISRPEDPDMYRASI